MAPPPQANKASQQATTQLQRTVRPLCKAMSKECKEIRYLRQVGQVRVLYTYQ